MKLTFLTVAFATSTLAAKFVNFEDKSCQRSDGTYVAVNAAQQQAIIEKAFASTPTIEEASRYLFGAEDLKRCPSNKDDTYKWVGIPEWQGRDGGRGGGSIAVVYYAETDTYSACRYLASVQGNNYAGFCR